MVFWVPAGASLKVTSGQVGTDMNDDAPKSLNAQVINTFAWNSSKIRELTGSWILSLNIEY